MLFNNTKGYNKNRPTDTETKNWNSPEQVWCKCNEDCEFAPSNNILQFSIQNVPYLEMSRTVTFVDWQDKSLNINGYILWSKTISYFV